MPEMPERTIVLGLGNPLMGDDGIGLFAMGRLEDAWFVPPSVEFVDGGTWGLSLLPIIDDADHLLVLDAIDTGAPAGTVVELTGDRIPAFLERTKLSPHQVDLRDVLALCELRGTLPAKVVVMGIQPQRVELVSELSGSVEDSLNELVWRAARQLQAWGVPCFEHELRGKAIDDFERTIATCPGDPRYGDGNSGSDEQARAPHAVLVLHERNRSGDEQPRAPAPARYA